MLQVKTGPDQTWEVELNKETISLNNTPFDWDIRVLGPHTFHIIRNNKSFTAEVVQADYASKTFTIKVNGKKQVVTMKDRFDLLLDKLGMSQMASQKINDIKAPMPGLILDIKVAPGQEVKKGDPIMILEAMKMENILKSPGDGVIGDIKVKERQNVEKNQVLVLFQ
ncbi:MAG: acetyl-CoA carboxylase biotin carboxyl carrier protein subunit [Hymenobacteraceae bacterium]|nr:acetyl-CoA carboxylase biotin carboxyl carrier protein subunit [Hymenobacteraceae bacterium]MDX5396246.1 acetyl-CoA carboxylase biotin carboxyl carrier protein subunit [Hymenobacteraceae bacterium]MDX5512309.1 acetyl-CoA carboxylase biotin carboxyl carrier protein subunit [Hymenobacteraceae bacterium]